MISNRSASRLFAMLLCVVSLLSFSSWAQDQDQYQDQNQTQNQDQPDPPSRVARMSFAQGTVSFQPGGEGDWVSAVPNRPLTSGDNLWTDHDSRAELHVGSTAIRLSGETSLTFLELDDRALQVRLPQGSMILNVRHLDDDEAVEVDTPNLAFTIESNGEYRVDVYPDGQQTVVSVYHGRGKAVGGGSDYTIVAGQSARFSGDDNLNYDLDSIPQYDDFANWAMERDRREDRSDSANYVSREVTGYEDLDEYGSWSYAGDYGHVWVPSGVQADWAPYRFGHWVWVAPWGWTWVDDEPWGFAPFHYGRWCQVRGRWAWVPGPVVVRPVYAPALVAFVGGGGFHLSIGVGAVAWFPLGPGEVYVPGYRVSPRYVQNVNITNTRVNVTQVTNVYNYYTVNNRTNVRNITYVNQRVSNSVTSVSHDTFINARPVARNLAMVPQRELEQAPVTHMVDARPERASVIGAGRPTTVAPPAAIANRRVVAERTPAAPVIPFNQRTNPWQARPPQSQIRMAEPVRPGQTREPNQPVAPARSDNAVRPETPVSRTPESNAKPSSEAWRANRPGQPGNRSTPPVEQPRPSQNDVPRDNARQADPNWSHPLAKPAPPDRPKTEPQMRDDESKFDRWKQQQPQQRPEPRQAAPPPARQERPAPKPPENKKEEHHQ
jgi:hypothetical protein